MRVPADPQTGPNFRRQGAIILSLFALIWAMAGASGIGDGIAFWGIGAFALAVTVGAIALAVRTESTRTAPRHLPPDWQRQYNIVGIVQGVAILVAIAALVSLGAQGLIPPVVCFIVGLHFLPLQRTFDQPEYRATALALCGVAAIGAGLLSFTSDEAVRAVVGFGAAVVLWGTAIVVARTG